MKASKQVRKERAFYIGDEFRMCNCEQKKTRQPKHLNYIENVKQNLPVNEHCKAKRKKDGK